MEKEKAEENEKNKNKGKEKEIQQFVNRFQQAALITCRVLSSNTFETQQIQFSKKHQPSKLDILNYIYIYIIYYCIYTKLLLLFKNILTNRESNDLK